MKLGEINNILEAEFLWGETYSDRTIEQVCGSDMLSEVLAFSQAKSLLLTSLHNTQVIRTADMAELAAVCFVRDKRPSAEAGPGHNCFSCFLC